MRRRDFIAGIGGVAAWPLPVGAQPNGQVRRVGNLWARYENDPLQRSLVTGLSRALAELGWIEGRTLVMDHRWNPNTAEQAQAFAKELVDLHPDVLLTMTVRLVRAAQQQTKTIPIVMLGAGDPLAFGLVSSLSHPEGNTTGVTDLFPSIAGKWMEILKQCVPSLRRIALVFNPDRLLSSNMDNLAMPAVQAGSQNGVEVIKLPVRSIEDIGSAIGDFAEKPNSGLIVLPPPFSVIEREAINRLAIRHRMPTIYQDKSFAVDGGLLSYGADFLDMVQPCAMYIDRILRGAKPSDLPIQFPTKFTLVVNLRTAKAMGLTIPEAFLVRADEVIQ